MALLLQSILNSVKNMKSIIENLFAGLLEGSNYSNEKKNKKLDNKENFVADINQFLLPENQNTEVNENDTSKNNLKILSSLENNGDLDNKIINNKANKKLEEINSNIKPEVKGVSINKNSKDNILKYHTNNGFIETKKNKKNFNSITNINLEQQSSKKNLLSKEVISNLLNTNIDKSQKSQKAKKIKTFFQNYLNFNNSKKYNKNKKVLKFEANNLNNGTINVQSLAVRNKNIINNNYKDNNPDNILVKSNTGFEPKSSNLSLNLESSDSQKDSNLNKSNDNLLRNMLDIKSNNVGQRLAEIFERNVKLGNNRFEIEIKPENLGKIEVIMEINGENVEINLRVENGNVANLLADNNNNLQKVLNSHGLNLSNLNLNYNNQNKFGEDKFKKAQNEKIEQKKEDEDNFNNKVENHHKNNNLVYIKA